MLQFPYSPMMRQLLNLVPTNSGWIHSNMTPHHDRCSDMCFSRKNALAKIRMVESPWMLDIGTIWNPIQYPPLN